MNRRHTGVCWSQWRDSESKEYVFLPLIVASGDEPPQHSCPTFLFVFRESCPKSRHLSERSRPSREVGMGVVIFLETGCSVYWTQN